MGEILLIRHGQASFGSANYDKLSPTGEEQAQVLGRSLRGRLHRVDRVQRGAMFRHEQTMAGCLSGLPHKAPIEEKPAWNEYDHEEIIHRYKPAYKSRTLMVADLARTGNPRKAFQNMFGKAVERWMNPENAGDYKESWPEFCQRCTQALNDLHASMGKGETALVFTSNGPITAIIQELLRVPAEHVFQISWTLANCGVTKVIYSGDKLYLSSINEHSAFEGDFRSMITYR